MDMSEPITSLVGSYFPLILPLIGQKGSWAK